VTTADTDGDGLNDLEETIAGTGTNDPLSVLRATISNGPPIVVSVEGKAGRQYQLQAADNLPAQGWSNFLTTATVPANQTVSLPDTNAPTGSNTRSYRVKVTVPLQ